MIKLSESSFVSISLVVVIAGGVWGAAITHSVASNAYTKSNEVAMRLERTEGELQRRRELNEAFQKQVLADLAVIKSKVGVR